MDIERLAGTRLGNYEIESLLGRGGMGVVYKARQISLSRPVALKILPPTLSSDASFVKRFKREAEAIAQLDHPNLVQIFDIVKAKDLHFFSMQYVEGKTLDEVLREKGRLNPDEAVRIITQAAQGIEHAHKNGIIHRDIKPSNIILDESGNAKVMDFGLARTTEERSKLTQSGTLIGTLDYMSPEQCRGDELDGRTDIYSLGVVLYEALGERTPFEAPNEAALIHKIVNEDPPDIQTLNRDVPIGLGKIIFKVMAKDKEARYSEIGELLEDLRSCTEAFKHVKATTPLGMDMPPASHRGRRMGRLAIAAILVCLCIIGIVFLRPSEVKELKETESSAVSTAHTSEEKAYSSIAVLPFTDMSPDKDQEYFCDGMAETLINELTRIQDFKVIARTSAFSFKGQNVDVRDIGSTLNVETVLEGSVQKAGNKVRITAQLVDTGNGHHLWSAKFDRDMRDIFAIQDELSQAIVHNLKVKLSGREKAALGSRPAPDPEIYDLYLRGKWFWDQAGKEGLQKAIEYFERTIEMDPAYAPAYASLADVYLELPLYTSYPHEEAFRKAKEAVLQALEIDESLADAHIALGNIKMNYEWDWDGAERAFIQAIQLNPSSANAYHHYAEYLLYLARFDEAIEKIERAQELDPIPLWIRSTKARILDNAGHTDRAIEECRKILEMDPGRGFSRLTLVGCYMQKSMYEEALAEIQKAKGASGPWEPIAEAAMGMVYIRMGKRDEAEKILEHFEELSEQGHVVSFGSAILCFELEENDKAFAWLEKAYEQRESWLRTLKIWPGLDSVRSDRRFIAMLKKVGLDK
jgi:serine/threonine protein kinase/tetratricopeptide (TPR) repeat protein